MKPVLLEPRVGDGVPRGRAEVGRDGAVPLAADGHGPAEQLRLAEQLLVAVEIARVRSALVADLQELAGLAGGRHHAARPLEGVRHLLLAVHVLAGLQTVDRVLRVPEVGGGDDDRVELLLLLEHLAVVLVAADLVLEPRETVDDPLLVVLGPDVAHCAEAQAGDPEHRVGQHLALGSRAEEGHVDLLQIGRSRLRCGGCLDLRLLVLVLPAPRVAEETQRGDRGQPCQHLSPVEFPRSVGPGLRRPLVLLVLTSHRCSPDLHRNPLEMGGIEA